ncbi:MAG TPA: ATP-binding protein [Candidatus Moranbacteria bacterium]|nr:ATP-binding protein [Candidatus Moranbacteria bacterium]
MFEGPLFQFSRVFFGILAMTWILVLLIRKYRKSEVDFKKQIWLMGLGMELFLFSFFMVTFLAAYLTDLGILSDSRLEYYGLFGMDIFIGLLAYLIVRYRAFHIKLFAAQALVIGTIILIASQFAFIQDSTNRILTAVTLAIVSTFGWWLVKSVKAEIKQKEELKIANAKISSQNDQLEVANVELKKADQAKNEFINIASHQLRTPITVIKGTISMLQDGTMDSFNGEQKKKFYDGARSKCQKLEDIINDILNATSLTNKKFNVMDKEIEKIDVKEFFEKMIDGFKAETLEREIDLSIGDLDASVPEVFGQRKYLEEAFSNLLTNAIKYTPSPKQTPDVRDKRDGKATIIIGNRRDGDDVIFSVKDNGIGIPAEEIPNLFKKFARAQNAVDMYTDGTGLGLFIIKEIVEGHGGKVWVESELGKGAEFFVKLPIKPKNKVDIKEYIKKRADIKM